MDSCHPAEIYLTEDHRVQNFCNGIRLERSTEGEKEVCLPLALEEVEVAEDRPIRAETRMRVLIILRQPHRKSPDLQGLVETL